MSDKHSIMMDFGGRKVGGCLEIHILDKENIAIS